ncbi:MAG: def2 [Amycolatopsis sp.]|nr:def2 [Amycolatopsis sp.]
MTIQPIRIAGDPVLHTPTSEVVAFDADLKTLADDMFETMYASGGVGLAANQIGVGLCVFVYDCPDAEDNWHVGLVVNPRLTKSALPETLPDPDTDKEGCLSVPGESYPTRRAAFASVTGFDVDGREIEVHGDGTLARCFQHETDHLDGRLYLDRLIGEQVDEAKVMIGAHGWGVPGHSWLPEPPEDTPRPVGRDVVIPGGRQRGPVATEPVRPPRT